MDKTYNVLYGGSFTSKHSCNNCCGVRAMKHYRTWSYEKFRVLIINLLRYNMVRLIVFLLTAQHGVFFGLLIRLCTKKFLEFIKWHSCFLLKKRKMYVVIHNKWIISLYFFKEEISVCSERGHEVESRKGRAERQKKKIYLLTTNFTITLTLLIIYTKPGYLRILVIWILSTAP